MVEFGLIAPLMLLLFIGTIEMSLLMFGRSSAESAAGEAARIAAQSGNAPNADTLATQSVRDSPFGHTRLAKVNEIDVYRLNQDPITGAISVDSAHVNHYRLDGTVIGTVSWPPAIRNVTVSNGDFLGVTVDYTYPWQTGIFGALPSPRLTAFYYVRIEPQTY